MGKKGNWFGAVKRVFSHESKEKREERKSKSKKKWLAKHKQEDPSSVPVEIVPESLPPAPPVEVKLTDADNEQRKNAYSVALANAVSAEAAAAAAQAAQAAQEVVRLTTVSRYSGKSKEEVAAIKIQTAFRGYLARRALRALRGLVRLKTLIDGQSVKRQATTTLRCMQTLARVQSQIRARRIRMSEENQALQRQLQQKHEKELETLRATMGDDWNDSLQSKEQMEAKLMHKHEAAMRRERALAYAFSHQQTLKNSSRSGNPTFMDPNNPHWGWSWLERWMAARPWEASRSMTDKELNNDHSSLKSATPRSVGGGEINKAYARRDLNHEKPSPSPKKLHHIINRNSPSTPPSKAASSSSVTGKVKPASSHGSLWAQEEDTRSSHSMQSDKQPRRHSVAGSSTRDDESLTSSPTVPSYMAPTESARAKTRFQSPLGIEKHETPQEKVSVGSAKKRLSFTASPTRPTGPRRHSGPPKVESVPFKDIVMHPEQSVSNGGSR